MWARLAARSPMEQGAWGRDPRPWGLSGGLVTGLSGAPSQPTQPERVLGWLPAPSQAVGPGPLGELSLGSARKSLWGPQESSSTALLTPDGRQEEEGRPAGRPRDVGCPVGQRADHGRPLAAGGPGAGSRPVPGPPRRVDLGDRHGVGTWACSFMDTCPSPAEPPHRPPWGQHSSP